MRPARATAMVDAVDPREQVARARGLRHGDAWERAERGEQRAGLAPGSAFGAGDERSVRSRYAAEHSVLEAALERLARFL